MLIPIIVVVILFLILPPEWATLFALIIGLRFLRVGDLSSVNVMGGSYITEEGAETLKRIRMRHEHEQGRKLRDLADAIEADDRMERISHMMTQADKAEGNDKPIAVRTLEYPYSQKMREKGEREAASILERLKGDDEIYEVDDILGSRLRKGKREYLIKWKGYGNEENTYEPSKNIPNELIREFRKRQRERRPVYGRSRK